MKNWDSLVCRIPGRMSAGPFVRVLAIRAFCDSCSLMRISYDASSSCPFRVCIALLSRLVLFLSLVLLRRMLLSCIPACSMLLFVVSRALFLRRVGFCVRGFPLLG